MNLPVPSAQEVRWTFYVAGVSALALVAVLCWAIVQRVDQYDTLVDRLASDATQIERLTERDDASARQRAALQRQNRDIRAELRRSNRQLSALVTYLREHGIDVPQTFTAPRSGGGGSSPKGPTPSGASPKPSQPDPATPPGTPTPTPTPGVLDPICDLVPALCPAT